MSAADHFKNLQKDVKFVAETGHDEKIEADIAVQEKVDKRPLYIRLAEQRQKKDDEINEIYRLANRIRKLDEDEVLYLAQLNQETREREEAIRLKEKEELEIFRRSAETLATKVVLKEPAHITERIK